MNRLRVCWVFAATTIAAAAMGCSSSADSTRNKDATEGLTGCGDAGTTTDAGTGADAVTSDAGSVGSDAGAPDPAPSSPYATQALSIADFILSQENADGAIPDNPGGGIVNEDSNMEYALIGLAAAYWYSRDDRYRAGLEKGIAWLAAREEMSDPTWSGSFWYTYASTAPYAHVATSPGAGVSDVRGVDATSALFAYLLYLDARLTGDATLATTYAPNANAALHFVLDHNISKSDGFSLSSFQLTSAGWAIWPYEYAADQGDVYLGLAGGAKLYDTAANPTFGSAATFLSTNTPPTFYLTSANRYAIGRDQGGSLDSGQDNFDGVFPNGYLPWMWGPSTQATGAYQWLAAGQQADGSIVPYSGSAAYTLSVTSYVMAATALGQPTPTSAINWLLTTAYDPSSGAVRDTADPGSDIISNVQGFSVVALLGFPAMP